MGMGCSCCFRQRTELRCETKLSQKQQARLAQDHLTTLRMELVQELRQERYAPKGTCPNCSKILSTNEILRGFNRDVNDFTTCCPKCHTRFDATLVCFSGDQRLELPFYCSDQVLHRLDGKNLLSPEQFSKNEPAIYRSAIIHFGSLKGAFSRRNIAYDFTETHDWKNKITPYLGKLHDTIIADCVGEKVRIIRKLRKKLNIPRFTKKTVRDEMED